MDIQKKLHAIANKRQVVLWGLDADATESDKIRAKMAFDETTKMLNDMATAMTSKMKEDACQTKGCPHYALGQDNGCTIYENISICADSKKED